MNNLTILTCDDIEATDLVAVLEAVNTLDTAPQVEHLKYLMADWWNAAGIFKDFATGMQDLRPSVADCISGCTFGDWLEVIWRQIGSTFRLVLIAEIDVSVLLDDKKSGGAHWQSAEAEANRVADEDPDDPENPFEIILWGTECIQQTPISTWVEARIPRLLAYPDQPQQITYQEKQSDGKLGKDFSAVFLKIKAYYDASGRPVIYRKYGMCSQLESPEHRQNRELGKSQQDDQSELVSTETMPS